MIGMTMEQEIQAVIDKFHKKVENDPELKKELMPIKKTINLDLGEEKYSMKIEEARVSEFKKELLDAADLQVTTTPESLRGLINGTLRPMKAYVLKKIRVKGKIDDLMFLKKFF